MRRHWYYFFPAGSPCNLPEAKWQELPVPDHLAGQNPLSGSALVGCPSNCRLKQEDLRLHRAVRELDRPVHRSTCDARAWHAVATETFADEWGFAPLPFEEWWELRSKAGDFLRRRRQR